MQDVKMLFVKGGSFNHADVIFTGSKKVNRVRWILSELGFCDPYEIYRLCDKVGVQHAALTLMVRTKPRQLVAMIAGFKLIDLGEINTDFEINRIDLMGLNNWLKHILSSKGVEQLSDDLGISYEAIIARKKTNPERFIATVYGLKIVK